MQTHLKSAELSPAIKGNVTCPAAERTIDKAVVHPEAHKVATMGHVMPVTLPSSCLRLRYLVLMVREDKVPVPNSLALELNGTRQQPQLHTVQQQQDCRLEHCRKGRKQDAAGSCSS